ncbi:Spy/CpxP family protein refolding chaperone [Pleurocapsa sp. PCC 7319]|uniref:Spy/CpxP family protein refolding chaperone n=1 Tax=Pleurocapsa sp. PCC 7319 TaxID=118161 RepID=UPI001ED9BA1A|nr:Spy/CpxP family protein refolding chaperone [Pleurocapsa sp. PCC 7319]
MTLFMLHSSPVLAASQLFFSEEDKSDCTLRSAKANRAPYPKNHLAWGEKIANQRAQAVFYLSKVAITIADSSVSVTESQKPFNLLQQLNLTSEQQQQIRQIHRKYRQKIRQKKQSLTVLQQQLSDMMVGTETVELIRAKNQQLLALRQEIEKLRFESMLATREILTLSQRQKFREIMESHLAQ